MWVKAETAAAPSSALQRPPEGTALSSQRLLQEGPWLQRPSLGRAQRASKGSPEPRVLCRLMRCLRKGLGERRKLAGKGRGRCWNANARPCGTTGELFSLPEAHRIFFLFVLAVPAAGRNSGAGKRTHTTAVTRTTAVTPPDP